MVTAGFGIGIANFNASSMARFIRFLRLDLRICMAVVFCGFQASLPRPLNPGSRT